MVKYADTVYIIVHVHLDTNFEVLSKVASVAIVTLDVSFSRFTKILENLEILTRSNANRTQLRHIIKSSYELTLLHFLCSLSNFIQLHQVTTWLLAVLYHILYTAGKHSSPFYWRPFRHHLSAREFKNVWYYFTLNKTSSTIEGWEHNMVRK